MIGNTWYSQIISVLKTCFSSGWLFFVHVWKILFLTVVRTLSMIQLGFPCCSQEPYSQLKKFSIASLTLPELCRISPTGCLDLYSERKPLSLQIYSLKTEEDFIQILVLDEELQTLLQRHSHLGKMFCSHSVCLTLKNPSRMISVA